MGSSFRHERKIISRDVVVWEMSGVPTENQWSSFLETVEVWLSEQEARGRRWGVVIDPSKMEGVSAEMRRIAGQWRAQNMALIANTSVCGCYVATSAMIRGAITAVFWFAQPVIPVSVRGSQEDAHQWVLTKLNDVTLSA